MTDVVVSTCLVPLRPGEGAPAEEAGEEILSWFSDFVRHFLEDRADDVDEQLELASFHVLPTTVEFDQRELAAEQLSIDLGGGSVSRRARWVAYWLRLSLAIDADAVNARVQRLGRFLVIDDEPTAVASAGPRLIEIDGNLYEIEARGGEILFVRDGETIPLSRFDPSLRERVRAIAEAGYSGDRLTTYVWPHRDAEEQFLEDLYSDPVGALWFLRRTVRPSTRALSELFALAQRFESDLAGHRAPYLATVEHVARRLGDVGRPFAHERLCHGDAASRAAALMALVASSIDRLPIALGGIAGGTGGYPTREVIDRGGEVADLVEQALDQPMPLRRVAAELAGRLSPVMRTRPRAIARLVALANDHHHSDAMHGALLGLFNIFFRAEEPIPAHVHAAFDAARAAPDVRVAGFAQWAAQMLFER